MARSSGEYYAEYKKQKELALKHGTIWESR